LSIKFAIDFEESAGYAIG